MKKSIKKVSILGIVALFLAVAIFASNNTISSKAFAKKYTITLYKGNSNSDGFIKSTAKIKYKTAYSIIKELKSIGAVSKKVKANSLAP